MDDLRVLGDLLLRPIEQQKFLNFKEHGEWKSWSFAEFKRNVVQIAQALESYGLRNGDSFGIISNSSPYWLCVDFAVGILGAHTVPLFPNLSPVNFKTQIQETSMRAIFCPDPNQLDPEYCEILDALDFVLTLNQLPNSNSVNWNAFLKSNNPNDFDLEGKIAKLDANQIATIIYTSGSMGQPKGVCLSHANLCSQINQCDQLFPVSSEDKALSVLPLAHIFERTVCHYLMSMGLQIFISDDIQKTGDYLQEIKPQIATLVPRILEKIHHKLASVAHERKGFEGFFLRKSFARAMKADPFQPTWIDHILEKLIYQKIRHKIGGEFRYIVVGGARLDPQIAHFFMNIGLPIFEGYGLTECSPVLSANRPGQIKIGSVGKAFPGVEIKIGHDQEILAKGPGIMLGYFDPIEMSSTHLDPDGYFATGDLGRLDQDQFLWIEGRKKELLKTANGKYISPIPLEQNLMIHCPLIEHALIIAEGRPFVSVLLFPDYAKETSLRHALGIVDPTLSFWDQPKVINLIEEAIAKTNRQANHWEGIRKWRWVYERLSVENGDLTPKMNLRRKHVEQQFRDTANSLYI